MSEETRQARRQRQRALIKDGEAVVRRGLGRAPETRTLAALALVLRRALDDPEQGARQAAWLMHAAYDATARADPPRDPVACKKGCGYCCRSVIAATAPEVLLLAATLRRNGIDGGLMDRLAVTSGKDRLARFGKKLPCALLRDEACSLYRERPLVCRQVLSFDLAPCLEEYEGIDGEFSVPAKPLRQAGQCATALLAALSAADRPTGRYELSAALVVALGQDDAERRWLAGEDVFAGTLVLGGWTPPMTRLAGEIAPEIA